MAACAPSSQISVFIHWADFYFVANGANSHKVSEKVTLTLIVSKMASAGEVVETRRRRGEVVVGRVAYVMNFRRNIRKERILLGAYMCL